MFDLLPGWTPPPPSGRWGGRDGGGAGRGGALSPRKSPGGDRRETATQDQRQRGERGLSERPRAVQVPRKLPKKAARGLPGPLSDGDRGGRGRGALEPEIENPPRPPLGDKGGGCWGPLFPRKSPGGETATRNTATPTPPVRTR